jgi:hypothetical protein
MLDVLYTMPLQNTPVMLEQKYRAAYLLEARIYRICDEQDYNI